MVLEWLGEGLQNYVTEYPGLAAGASLALGLLFGYALNSSSKKSRQIRTLENDNTRLRETISNQEARYEDRIAVLNAGLELAPLADIAKVALDKEAEYMQGDHGRLLDDRDNMKKELFDKLNKKYASRLAEVMADPNSQYRRAVACIDDMALEAHPEHELYRSSGIASRLVRAIDNVESAAGRNYGSS